MTIKAVIFDLDGTLYFDNAIGREIGRCAALYISRLKGIEYGTAREIIRATRRRLNDEQGVEVSLSLVCQTLGGNLRDLHACFTEEIVPETHLAKNGLLTATLEALAARFQLHIYTNNNLHLASRIMEALGVSHLFNRIYTIESFWKPKPDPESISVIMHDIGLEPSECLFVGDRYDIDLRLPEKMGGAVHLVKSMEDFQALLRYIE
jgi:putative hydrolase of the HAD superfamily